MRTTIRGVKARKREDTKGALLPVLLVSYNLSQSQWKRKENLQLFALHPTSCSKHIKGRQSREKCEQLLSAVGLSQVHPSVHPSWPPLWQSGRAAPGLQCQTPALRCWLSPHTGSPNTAAAQQEVQQRFMAQVQLCVLQRGGELISSRQWCLMWVLLKDRGADTCPYQTPPRAVGGWNIGTGKTEWLRKALVDKEGQSCAWLKWDQSWTAQQCHSWGAVAAVSILIEKLFFYSPVKIWGRGGQRFDSSKVRKMLH